MAPLWGPLRAPLKGTSLKGLIMASSKGYLACLQGVLVDLGVFEKSGAQYGPESSTALVIRTPASRGWAIDFGR